MRFSLDLAVHTLSLKSTFCLVKDSGIATNSFLIIFQREGKVSTLIFVLSMTCFVEFDFVFNVAAPYMLFVVLTLGRN